MNPDCVVLVIVVEIDRADDAEELIADIRALRRLPARIIRKPQLNSGQTFGRVILVDQHVYSSHLTCQHRCSRIGRGNLCADQFVLVAAAGCGNPDNAKKKQQHGRAGKQHQIDRQGSPTQRFIEPRFETIDRVFLFNNRKRRLFGLFRQI